LRRETEKGEGREDKTGFKFAHLVPNAVVHWSKMRTNPEGIWLERWEERGNKGKEAR